MLSQTTEYALKALSHLAASPDEWHEVRHVSEVLGIPCNYLSKVLGQLTKLGILQSRKGWGGGFRIRGDPRRIALDRVVRPLEGLDRPRRCAFGLPECSDDDPCPLHEYWKRIIEIHEAMLRETTVADLVVSGGASRRLRRAHGEGVASCSRAEPRKSSTRRRSP